MLAALMEVIIDRFRHLRADAANAFEIGDAGAAHGLGRTEILQQRPLARRPDARHLVERRGGDAFLAPRAVGADGKPVRLVPKRLNAVKHRVARFQKQRRFSLKIDALVAGIAVGALGPVSYTHLRAHETDSYLVCRLL